MRPEPLEVLFQPAVRLVPVAGRRCDADIQSHRVGQLGLRVAAEQFVHRGDQVPRIAGGSPHTLAPGGRGAHHRTARRPTAGPPGASPCSAPARAAAIRVLALFCLIFSMEASPAGAQPSTKMTPALESLLRSPQPTRRVRAWVYFADKGQDLPARLAALEKTLTPESTKRRLRNRPQEHLVDEFDLPVRDEYARQVAAAGADLLHRSRWLNAVSVLANREQLEKIATLSYVMKIDIVRSAGFAPEPVDSKPLAPATASGIETEALGLNYGPSLAQEQLVDVPPLHQMGLDGSGVLIAMLDAGFNILEHEALDHLNIVAAWDFVNNDGNVDDEPGQLGSGSHGSMTLSVIGGFQPGSLIGPAYAASYALAKTEDTGSEQHIEEDNWVAGAEWADSLGADIISSSLGYRDGFLDGNDYTSQDMDGKTTIVTLGAEIAASRGILVVNSVGNGGFPATGENTLWAPSDGPAVLAVGAVDRLGARVSFSSVGPTSDGRIKPDVVAMGAGVLAVSTANPAAYSSVSGTSFSCPLVAGAAALLLQARPALTNADLRDILRATANNAAAPDTLIGWGIIDALAALNITNVASEAESLPDFKLFPAYPNPFNPETVIRYDLKREAQVTLGIYNSLGQKVRVLVNSVQAPGNHSTVWNGRDTRGATVAGGIYFYRLQTGQRAQTRRVLFLK